MKKAHAKERHFYFIKFIIKTIKIKRIELEFNLN